MTSPEFRPIRILNFTLSRGSTSAARFRATDWISSAVMHARNAWSSRARGTKDRHQAIAGELVDSTLVSLNNCGRPVEQCCMISRSRSGSSIAAKLHRTHHVREKDGDLLTLPYRAARIDS